MHSEAIDPRSSRGLVKRRVFESTIAISAIFLVLVIGSSWVISKVSTSFLPMLAADVVAGLVAYYAYLIWNRQPIRLACNGCGGRILCNTPWVCGECGHENFNVRKYPFLGHCEHCELEPKAYVCHHCDRVMFLSEDRDVTNPARRIEGEVRRKKQEFDGPSRRKAELAELYAARKSKVEGKRLDLEEARLDAQIQAIKKGPPEVTIRTQLDVLFESLKSHMERAMAVDEAVRRMNERVIQECKGNRTEIRRRNLVINEWKRKQMPEMQ